MRKLTLSAIALGTAAFFAVVQFASPAAFAQPAAAAQMGQTQQSQHVQLPGKNPANAAIYKHAQIFMGTISKQNGHYVLTAGQFTYKLNEQSKLAKYKGEQVQITGKLNPKTNKVHVLKIKKASSGY